jgi:hypothetical protein
VGGCTPSVNDPSSGMSVSETVALIDGAPSSEVGLTDLAEAFAFGTKVTQAQRDELSHELVGHTVEWDIPVADVGYAEGRFAVTSQPIPTANRAEAVPVLRVVAFVLPRNDADQLRLLKARADDVIRVRGIVQEIRAGKTVALVPAVAVPSIAAGE